MPDRKTKPPKHRKLRQAIIDTCLAMNRQGINQGTSGNVSARVPEGFLLTPSGIAYDAMTPEMIALCDLDGGYRGDWLPSSEWRMHLAIYRARPEAQAVVHVHSTHATALSCLRKPIPAFHYMVAVCGGADIRCADYATFGTAELSDAMVEALEGRSGCLLSNHGQIVFGPSLDKALWRAGEVEALAHQYVVASRMGKPVILPADEMARVIARFATYGKQAHELPAGTVSVIEPPVRRDG